jgi:mono/diheme cytochrome c family protein
VVSGQARPGARPGTGRGLWAVLLLVLACGEDPLMRMVNQKKARPNHASTFFEDRRVVRVPPAGTVARERRLDLELKAPPMTLDLLRRGQHRYDIVCATCHGLTGEADTVVASNFALRHPPSLHEPRLREKSDEHIFGVIGLGYGLMPSFPDIPVEERWAIVGYVRALQLTQRVSLDAAPPEVRRSLNSLSSPGAEGRGEERP